MLIDEIATLVLTTSHASIDTSPITSVIKVTGHPASNKIVLLFSNKRNKLGVAKLAFNEYAQSNLSNEKSLLRAISQTKMQKYVPKEYYHGELYNIHLLIQEYISGELLFNLIAKETYRSNFAKIQEYCFFSMALLLRLQNICEYNLKPERVQNILGPALLIDDITFSQKQRSNITAFYKKLKSVNLIPGIFHGDFCIDNILVRECRSLDASLIDWEFGQLKFLKELDALFFCLSFAEAIFFRVLNFKNKNIPEFVKFLMGENEFTRILNKTISYYFAQHNLYFSPQILYSFLIILLCYLSNRESGFLAFSGHYQSFYGDILRNLLNTNISGGAKWLKLA